MKLLPRFSLSALLLLTSHGIMAAESPVDTLTKNLAKNIPGALVSRVKETPIKGIYEVIVGAEIYYMDISARYIINGDLIDLATRINITEEAKVFSRKAKLAALGEKNMIIYTPKKVDHTITVVTDIDCPYCRRLHSEIDEYLKNNVKVRYIFMPLKGPEDLATTVSVWCSEDRNLALDMAKAGVDIEAAVCENPIQQHLELSRELQVRGTPAIILEDGTMIPGYVAAEKLLLELNKVQASAK